MKRILFTAIGIVAFLNAYCQVTDTTEFKSRKLKVNEINLVSSYYTQDGNNAAVTGGIGSQKLTDIANVFDLKLVRYDKKQHKQSLDIELGIDHYTSASSDKVDLQANSSASHADTRIYSSVNWNIENENKGQSFGGGLALSTEYDYKSYGANLSFSKKTKDKNGEFSARVQAYLDKLSLIAPLELRTGSGDDKDYGSAARNTFAGSLSYSQIINERLQLMLLADIIQQNGYLSLPFHRVYFNDGSVHQENLPSSRLKIPLGFRANYFLGDMFIIRSYYRFYSDDWGIKAHTAQIEVPVKLTPFLSISPFFRYYEQSSGKYFAAYGKHTTSDQYYASNYDLSAFNSNFFGTGIRFAPPKGVLRIQRFNVIELRYGHYSRSNGLLSDIISLHLKFK